MLRPQLNMSQDRLRSSVRSDVETGKEKPVRVRRLPRSCIPGRVGRAPKGRHCESGKTSGLPAGERSPKPGEPEELVLVRRALEAQRDAEKTAVCRNLHTAFLFAGKIRPRGRLHRETSNQKGESFLKKRSARWLSLLLALTLLTSLLPGAAFAAEQLGGNNAPSTLADEAENAAPAPAFMNASWDLSTKSADYYQGETIEDAPYQVAVYVPKNTVGENGLHFYPATSSDAQGRDTFDANDAITAVSRDTASNEDYDVYS